ncbi:SURF1 family protein [Zavarzinia compransoris]|uniref:SURF1-like protein n=1 Tax=Zavarzinia compransoris TaxID=1264899 RepID=A0A317DYM0_9PROT|nr:SURF1 family protein [Zavarzinia compransoris]PWR19847.1 SURF1 family protein [Zavarzinia compransoris]TDP45044.1 surfeit locus 1 family protein [Zavarzinia compransoris]
MVTSPAPTPVSPAAPASPRAPRRFRPTLWPTVVTTIVIGLLLALGAWQLNRMAWKQGLITALEERRGQPAVELPATIDDAEAWRYRNVTVTGTFRHEDEIHIIAYSPAAKQGYQIVTPMVRADGTTVLVNRGWVPLESRDAASRPDSLAAGTVTVTGMARPGWPQGYFVPDNSPATNTWFWGDLPAMAVAAHAPDALPLFVEADKTPNPGGLPIGGQSVINLRNDHLQYAITWFALAIGVFGVYFAYHFRPDEPKTP